MASSTALFVRDETFLLSYTIDPPYTTPSLTANLVCRLVFAIIANLVCLVPLKLLWTTGEFAAVVFILNIEVKNLETILYALIWRDDDLASWWPGYGLCDVMPYVHNFTVCLYLTCLLAIMRNLAQQVGLLRANPLTVRERRRRNLVHALIMFPVPMIQLAWIWPLTAQRYVIGPLVGCSWISSASWPYLVFFILMPVAVGLLTAFYAVLTFIRFRQVAKNTASALSNNRVAHTRAQRTRRRLYLMVISILVPFLPIVITLAVVNINGALPLEPFDYDHIHNHVLPYQWDTIILLPSESFNFAYTNICYIPIMSAIPVFVFFGMTKDAMNSYRRILVRLGLGNVFPSLYREYDPDRSAYANGTQGSNSMVSTGSTIERIKSAITTKSSSSGQGPRDNPNLQSLDSALSNAEEGRGGAQMAAQSTLYEDTPIELPHRNPFLLRTNLAIPIPFTLSLFKARKAPSPESGRIGTLDSTPVWEEGRPSRIQTRVWSDDDEVRLCNTTLTPQREPGHFDAAPAVVVETRLTRESIRRC